MMDVKLIKCKCGNDKLHISNNDGFPKYFACDKCRKIYKLDEIKPTYNEDDKNFSKIKINGILKE